MRHLAGVLAGVFLSPGAAWAGCACGAFEDLPVTFDVCLAACDGPLTEAALEELATWNAFVDLWRGHRGAEDEGTPRDGRNAVSLLSGAEIQRRYGAQVAPWVLGITFAPPVAGLVDGNAACPMPAGVVCPRYGGARDEDVDVILVADRTFTLDPLEAWASHLAGNAAPIWDARQVLAHELGHALGLRHEGRAAALMNPFHLEFPGVVATPDDVAAARENYPHAATAVSDLAVVGFTLRDGAYWGVFWEGDARRVRVSDFTVVNRGPARLAGIVTEIRVGDAVAGTLVCDLGPNGSCPLLEVAEVEVPAGLHGRQPVSVHVAPLVGEPVPADNTLVLGYVALGEGPPPAFPDAAVPEPDAAAPEADRGGPDAAAAPDSATAPDAATPPVPAADADTDAAKTDHLGDASSASGADASVPPATKISIGHDPPSGCTQGRPGAPLAPVALLLPFLAFARRRRVPVSPKKSGRFCTPRGRRGAASRGTPGR